MALYHWELLILTAKPTGLQAQTIHSWFDSCANQQNWTDFFMPHFSSTTSLPLVFFDSFTSVKIFETHHTHQVQYFQPTHTGHISASFTESPMAWTLARLRSNRDTALASTSVIHPRSLTWPLKMMVGRQAFPIGKVYFPFFFVKLSGGMSNNYPCAEFFGAFYPCTQRLEWTNMSSIISCHTCHSVWRLTDR